MKIYNSQLVMSLVYRSTLQVYITTMAWYREIHVQAPSCWLLVLHVAKKDNWACVLHYYPDTIQERQSKGSLKDTTYKY